MRTGTEAIRPAAFTGSVASAVAAILAAQLAIQPGAARAEDAEPRAPAASASMPELEEIVVTGYRKSLNAALDTKRDAIGAVDQIVAEDIAAFPELNLAESIQRIPGVAITRDAGEGRQISVRGLGAQFTRVRINGMEALATIGTSDANQGTNRERSFDFNVFASELFNSVTIHKTSSADMDEGSLGATVDLTAARPFDYNKFTFVTGGKLGYNDLASSKNPRATLLISDTWFDGKFGALLSAAFAKRSIVDDGSSTVRWVDSSGGTFGSLGPNYAASGSTATFPQIKAAFRPRLPRYEEYLTDERRLGITNSLQFKPTDKTLLTLDTLYAQLNGTREETQLENPTLSSTTAPAVTQIQIEAAQIDSRNNLLYAQLDNVDIRAEHRYDVLNTKFRQHVLTLEQGLTDKLKLNAQAGWAQSVFNSPISTTLTWDANHVNGYVYDFRNGNSLLPLLTYGNLDVTNPASWTLSQIRVRPNGVTNSYGDYLADLEWQPVDPIKLKAGGEFKKYDFSTYSLRRPNEGTIPANVATTATGSYATLTSLTGLDLPGATPASWTVPDLDRFASMFGLYNPANFPVSATANLANNFSATEKDTAGFLKMEFTAQLFSIPLRGDIGVRYVHTNQRTTGWTSVGATGQLQLNTVEHSYNDVLPALNLAANLTDDFLVRIGASKVMARAGLGNLNPGASLNIASASQKTYSAGNPLLDPFRAKAYDLGFEWYFARESLLSLALFYKDIDSFVETVRVSGQFNQNPSGLPDSVAIADCTQQLKGFDPNDPAQVAGCLANWGLSVPKNTPGGSLKGAEISYQQPFSFLPAPFNNFGTVLNYTHVDANVKYFTNFVNNTFVENSLLQLSKESANATLYYDNGTWSVRGSVAYRSPYLTNVPGQNNNDVEGTKSTLNVDAAAAWNVDDHLQLTAEGLNLTNQFQYQYVDSVGNRMSYYHQQGREYLLGARYKF